MTEGDGAPAKQRIVSLLPSITEIVAALGIGDRLVGRTHECDYPADVVAGVPVVTTTEISPHSMSQAEINDAVCGSLAKGHSLYGLDEAALRKADPSLVLTQALCDVCAVAFPKVLSTCGRLLASSPSVVSLEPTDLEEVYKTIETVAQQCGVEEKGSELLAQLRANMAAIDRGVAEALQAKNGVRPKLAFLEWNDPMFIGGHWIPDMCVRGGAEYALAKPRERSVVLSKEDIAQYDPDVILVAPCGFDADRAFRDTQQMYKHDWWTGLKAVREGRVYAADANSYFARPGPRLVEGTAIIAQILHGVDVGLVPDGAWLQVTAPAASDCQ